METKELSQMTEIILGIIVLCSLALNAWSLYRFQEQEKKFIKGMLSKNVEDYTNSEIAEKKPKKKEEEETLVSLGDLSDEQWEKAIKEENG